MEHLELLVSQVREAGRPVELEGEGQPEPLPAGVDLSAYRIVQEALTNALKHAGPARALVRVRYRRDELELEILDNEPDMRVVGEAGDGVDAVEAAARVKPDVALMDIRMPRLDGIEATRRIVARAGEGVRVLILTTFGLDEYVYEALRAGASGFMLKDSPPEELVDAVRVVSTGAALLAPAVTRSVIEEFARRSPRQEVDSPRLAELTERELE